MGQFVDVAQHTASYDAATSVIERKQRVFPLENDLFFYTIFCYCLLLFHFIALLLFGHIKWVCVSGAKWTRYHGSRLLHIEPEMNGCLTVWPLLHQLNSHEWVGAFNRKM